MKAYDCYISIGANLGDRQATMETAVKSLQASDKIQLVKVSSLYETPPWGNTHQPSFLNGALCVRTTISPRELLQICQGIEQKLGRERHEHCGPRTIDLDLLYIDGVSLNTPDLILPHPYMLERAFVLVPLQEIAPKLGIAGQTIEEYLNKLTDKDDVVLFKRVVPEVTEHDLSKVWQ